MVIISGAAKILDTKTSDGLLRDTVRSELGREGENVEE